MEVDLNCDMGESFGRYSLGQDEAILPRVTSVNIACGFHGGDPLVMARTLAMAGARGVAVGAHPSYPDLQGFGRRNMDLAPDEVKAMVLYQIGALAGLAREAKVELAHVKPHGALYNQAAKDRVLARAVAEGVAIFSRELILVGLAGSVLIEEGAGVGLRVANEGFPDRAYNPDGTLRSRRESGAVLESADAVAANAVRLATQGIMFEGAQVPIDTLCIHGDNGDALAFAAAARQALEGEGVAVVALRQVLASRAGKG
jgi:UPF0271 protein